MVTRCCVTAILLLALLPARSGHVADPLRTLDASLRARALAPAGRSRVIVRLQPGTSVNRQVADADGTLGLRLTAIGARVITVPDEALRDLAAAPGVISITADRHVRATDERTDATIGTPWVRQNLGLDGAGVTVAVVDSGIAGHDDLAPEKILRFVDFVNQQPLAYDDYGHGTHVAGILVGSGHDSGARRGIAPGASLVVEKVLDQDGNGYISNVIAAIDDVIANRDALHIRVVNLSIAAGVYQSYESDPLTLAAKRAVDAGIVVVSAAGNLGHDSDGHPLSGGIGAPGNAPWVVTVGASSHMGTPQRGDDTVAAFSSRGPSPIDFLAKPDLVAPGVGIESTTDAATTLFRDRPAARLWGTVPTATQPYLALTGTSMASPAVSGTIALMLQGNPRLTPNLVKAVLQYTAERRAGYDALTEGAGFLNARGAVELARALGRGPDAAAAGSDDPTPWSREIIWGNHRISAGLLSASANAWAPGVVWGSASTPSGDNVLWGTRGVDAEGNALPWGTSLARGAIVWGTAGSENLVWGDACGGADCPVPPAPLGPARGGDGASAMVAAAVAHGTDSVVWMGTGIQKPGTSLK